MRLAATTDVNGVATFTFAAGLFAKKPIVAVTAHGTAASCAVLSAKVITNTTTQCKVDLRGGLELKPLSGVSVNILAVTDLA